MDNVLPFVTRKARWYEARKQCGAAYTPADVLTLPAAEIEARVAAAGIVEHVEGAAETIVTYLDLPE